MTRTAARLRHVPGIRPWRRLVTEAWWLLPLAFGTVLYIWTATSGGNGAPFAGEKTDFYNLLADAFGNGQLHLSVAPLPELLALPDPYDPVANAAYRLHDASLYNDQYYVYFGAVPALLVFLPWSVLPLGGDLPPNLAAAGFAVLGLLFNLLLLRFALRRWLPDAPRWMAAAAALALTVSNIVPFVLRRPAVYEQVITAGYAFTAAAAWLLVSGYFSERRSMRRLALASLCLGLAAGCRPNLGLLSVVLVLIVLALWREGRGKVRVSAMVLGPFAACVLLVAAYNAARFGSPAEFGQSYQLAGVDVRIKDSFSPAYLIPGLFYYLLAPARHDATFPFFHISPSPHFPWTLPEGYDTSEAVGGLLVNVPITLFALLALAIPLHRRIGIPRDLGRLLALGVGLAFVLTAFVAMLFWASTERYEVDFAWLMALAAVLVWIALAQQLKGRKRRLVQAGGVALILWGGAFSIATSFTGYYDSLKTNDPGTYRDLAALASPVQTAAAMVAGKPLMLELNNVVIEARGPGERYISSATILKPAVSPGPVELVVVSPSDRTVRMVGGLQEAVPGTRLRIEPEAGNPVQVRVGGGELKAPVRLKRGLNTILLTTIPASSDIPGDVRVTDLRLR